MLGRILATLGGLLVVALFAALLAPLFVDWTNFRRDFEDQASQLLGKKVVVNGEVSARLLPFPSVTMEDVTVGTDVDGTPLVLHNIGAGTQEDDILFQHPIIGHYRPPVTPVRG